MADVVHKSNRSRRGRPAASAQTEFGFVSLNQDADRPGCWTLYLDGQPQSHVDTAHPDRLHFEYMSLLAVFADLVAPPGFPLRALHLGGGAMALPRYIEATRPHSAQLVIEHNEILTALVRRVIPLPRRASIRVRACSAESALEALPRGRFDLVIFDVPSSSPVSVSNVERVLDPRGVLAANLVRDPHPFATAIQAAFGHVLAVGDPNALRGKHSGNVVLAARKEIPLDLVPIQRALSRMSQRVSVQRWNV